MRKSRMKFSASMMGKQDPLKKTSPYVEDKILLGTLICTQMLLNVLTD